MKTYISMYRSEKNRQMDNIDLKALPCNDRVHFGGLKLFTTFQNGPQKWTSKRSEWTSTLFLPLQFSPSKGDRCPFLHDDRSSMARLRTHPSRSRPKKGCKILLSGDRSVAKQSIPQHSGGKQTSKMDHSQRLLGYGDWQKVLNG